ncbi:RND superfamily putative drug exporter [Mycobacteroides chelonae]|nr:RND superfamily putative drug exporter [Mycobacteroides chelonae]
MERLARISTGRRSAVMSLLIGLAIVGAVFATLPALGADTAPPQGGPESSESAQAEALLRQFPDAHRSAALVVFAAAGRGALTVAERAAITTQAQQLATLSTMPEVVRPVFSPDGAVALVSLPVTTQSEAHKIIDQAAQVRSAARQGLPSGLESWLTGPVGFQADTATAFTGADVRLLLVTASVVAVLLIITYRSPLLWIVPLLIVGVADGLARSVAAALAPVWGLTVDASIMGILSVLVFGAGTNYALLLIARYREELHVQADPRAAMRTAVVAAGPAVLASAATVALSLLMLLFASLDGNRALGAACAVGVALAVTLVLGLLPAALVLCGRKVFWPFIPRYEESHQRSDSGHRMWAGIGAAVARRPWRTIVAATALLAVLSAGLAGARIGLSRTEQFLGNPESVRAQQLLTQSFPDDQGSQITVLTPDAAATDCVQLAQRVEGVSAAQMDAHHNGWTRIAVSTAKAPQSTAAYHTVDALRGAFSRSGTPLSQSLVGGPDAASFDQVNAAAQDRRTVIPLILAAVALILVILLRSLIAPLCLMATVIVTYVASLGAANWLFRHIFGFAAFDTQVLLLAFLFLVALGVDYNIFLATRAREELRRRDAREAMRYALTHTGAVITSAGVLLAAVFVVLGVLPVVALAQIGVIVCVGVLLDTLVVRTLLVPALAHTLGDTFWWPGEANRRSSPARHRRQ